MGGEQRGLLSEAKTRSPVHAETPHRRLSTPVCFRVEPEQLILKFTWECKGPWRAKAILKKNQVGGFTPPQVNTYFRTTAMDRAMLV